MEFVIGNKYLDKNTGHILTFAKETDSAYHFTYDFNIKYNELGNHKWIFSKAAMAISDNLEPIKE